MNAKGHRELVRDNERLRKRVAELERGAAESADAFRFLQSLLMGVPAFIARIDRDLRVRYVNQYQPGLGPEQVIGQPAFTFLAPAYHGLAREVFERVLRTGEPGQFETLGVGPHGQAAIYETHVRALPDADGLMGLCLIAFEVTAQKQREQALSESEQKLRVALEATGLGLWSWDIESGEIVWDAGMRKLHGSDTPSDLHRYIDDLVHPADRAEFAARAQHVLETGAWVSSPYRIVRPDGDVRWLLSNGRVVRAESGRAARLMGGTLDVTEPHALEEQLRQAQRMEALGNLTAGIAHNFNNMLTVIMPTLELAVRLVPAERQALLEEAAHAARRASELVRQLMTFAGQTRANERAPHPINEIIEAAASICRRAFDRRVQLTTSFEPPLARVMCNAGQIEQVLVNLLLNARDAVLDAGPGRGHIAVSVRPLAADALPEGMPGPCVAIRVRDDGVGMSEEVKSRVFEPFFTTKDVGRGTGLGLATSYAIVRDHRGTLSCTSETGAGTTFTIVLPISTESRDQVSSGAREALPGGVAMLLVDDEPSVRNAVGQVLRDAGLRVLTAASGDEALTVLGRGPAIDVVLLDRSMPDAPGETFVPRIRELAPNARVLFFTGQTIDARIAALADGIVHKPVLGEELLTAVRRALAGPTLRGA
jgi:PAS domain S-box-containing protein